VWCAVLPDDGLAVMGERALPRQRWEWSRRRLAVGKLHAQVWTSRFVYTISLDGDARCDYRHGGSDIWPHGLKIPDFQGAICTSAFNIAPAACRTR
jgi:hypothetical protein